MADFKGSKLNQVKKYLLHESLQIDYWWVTVFVCFALLAWISWGKLTHAIFDIGQETEIAARLLTGEILYRDLQTYYAPLAFYANALVLLLFGHHLEVFYGVGLTLALTTIGLIYHLVKSLTSAPWAAICATYVLIYCIFNPGGLFNFVVPYSYGAVYAIVFCLLAFTTLDRYSRTHKTRWLIAAAICCGLAGLAKQEYGVAAVVGVLVGVNLCVPQSLKTKVKQSFLVLLVTGICVMLPIAWLVQQSSWEQVYASLVPVDKSSILVDSGLFDVSFAETLRTWRSAFNHFVATSLVAGITIFVSQRLINRVPIQNQRLKYLAIVLGSTVLTGLSLFILRIPVPFGASILVVAASLVLFGLTLGLRWFLIRREIRNSQGIKTLLSVATIAACAGLSWVMLRRSVIGFQPLADMVWLLPFLAAWFAVSWRSLSRQPHAPLLWALLIFSVLLNARFWFLIEFYAIYGVTAVMLFFIWLYQVARQIGTFVWLYVLVALLLGGGINLTKFAQYRYPISSAYGTLYTKEENLALAYNQTIQYINQSGANSVLTVPAGAILNFLTATHSPSRETIFLPGVLATAEAEREFLNQMQQQHPELIVYVDVPFWWLNEGYSTYAEYNPLVHQWITSQHRLVYTSPRLVLGGKDWTLRLYEPR